MQVTPAEYGEGAKPVDGYGPGFFRIAGVVHDGSVVVGPQGVRLWGGLDDRAALLALAGSVDVLFIGMGADVGRPAAELMAALDAAGIMAEPMATPAAARTYNVLLAEGRRVACALLAL